jgi:hypothetical protein
MLTVLTVAAVFIAVVMAAVHWKTVREILLWVSAVVELLLLFFGLLALIGALLVFAWAAVTQDADLAYSGGALLLGCLLFWMVGSILGAIEERDRDKQFKAFRVWSVAEWHKHRSVQDE